MSEVPEYQYYLTAEEVRLITNTLELEQLQKFATSPRVHARDAKGDTALHLAARVGNLAICDLLVMSGLDPGALNYEQQTPAKVAQTEGHELVARLLGFLVPDEELSANNREEPEEAEITSERKPDEVPLVLTKTHRASNLEPVLTDDLGQLVDFSPEEDPESFHQSKAVSVSGGIFVPIGLLRADDTENDSTDWEINLSHIEIAGDAIGSSKTSFVDFNAAQDFLKVSRNGKRFKKQAVINTGTNLSIDKNKCENWLFETFNIDDHKFGNCNYEYENIDDLLYHCDGNGDRNDLFYNIKCVLDDAGLVLDDQDAAYNLAESNWDPKSDVDLDDLTEGLEAALTRSTRLPGTQRFRMSQTYEAVLFQPLVQANQRLLLQLLESEPALNAIFDALDDMQSGLRDVRTVTLQTIYPDAVAHEETNSFFNNVEILRQWVITDRVMHGRQRRDALSALDALDLSLSLLKEIVNILQADPSTAQDSVTLNTLLAEHELTERQIIFAHLPLVRRFSSRNVAVGEEVEDVFQEAYMGMHYAVRRFDPDRGYSFVSHSSLWMQQVINRWRADKGSAIRIPVHRSANLNRLDKALERLGTEVTDSELAVELELSVNEVSVLRKIPRISEYLEIEEWEETLPPLEQSETITAIETQRIVAEALDILEEREAAIIKMRFGIGVDAEMTLEQIGQLIPLTRERVRQIEQKALMKLSHPMRKKNLKKLLGV